MVKEIRISMDDVDYEKLTKIKDKKGNTWREMLYKGAEHL